MHNREIPKGDLGNKALRGIIDRLKDFKPPKAKESQDFLDTEMTFSREEVRNAYNLLAKFFDPEIKDELKKLKEFLEEQVEGDSIRVGDKITPIQKNDALEDSRTPKKIQKQGNRLRDNSCVAFLEEAVNYASLYTTEINRKKNQKKQTSKSQLKQETPYVSLERFMEYLQGKLDSKPPEPRIPYLGPKQKA